MYNATHYNYRVTRINKLMSLLKNLTRITNFYLCFINILSIYNIFWILEKLITVSKFENAINIKLNIILWIYLFITVNHVILYVAALIYNNFQKKWFYVGFVLAFIVLVGFLLILKRFTIKQNIKIIVCEHFAIKNIDYINDDNTKLMLNFLFDTYNIVYFYVIIMIIMNLPLVIIFILNLILHYKLIYAYKIINV